MHVVVHVIATGLGFFNVQISFLYRYVCVKFGISAWYVLWYHENLINGVLWNLLVTR